MGIYEKFIGLEEPRLPVHQTLAVLGEFARNRITAAQGRAIIEAVSGVVLTASEQTEFSTLLGTVSGSATAKMARAKEIDDVLMLAENRAAGYDTADLLRTRLGV